MNFFSLTDATNPVTFGRFSTVESAVSEAMSYGRKAGYADFRCTFTTYTAVVYGHTAGGEQVTLFYIAPLTTRPRVAKEPALPKPKELKFSGKPPADGWYKTPHISAQERALLHKVQGAVASTNIPRNAFFLVKVDNECDVVGSEVLSDFAAEARKALSGMRNGQGVEPATFAKKHVMEKLLSMPQTANVAGVYLFQHMASGMVIAGKRLIK